MADRKRQRAKSKKPLKLFVWEGVLKDYTAGAAWALARDAEHARKLIAEAMGRFESDLAIEPEIVTRPKGFYVYGGG